MFLRRLIAAFWGNAREAGLRSALARLLLTAGRVLAHPGPAGRALAALAPYRGELGLRRSEQFFFLQHRHYLSRRLSVHQRLAAVRHHYVYQSASYLPAFRQSVYERRGLALWRQQRGDTEFSIRLGAHSGIRTEGELSLFFRAGEELLGLMSFSFVDAGLFGLPSAPVVFITRNQSCGQDLQQGAFREVFKHTTPQYLCLAALSGVAQAHGMSRMLAIGHDQQVAYQPAFHANLVNAYTGFWQAFKATPLAHHAVYSIALPMRATPLAEVKAKHRGRALQRRAHWADVSAAAASVSLAHQRQRRVQASVSPRFQEPAEAVGAPAGLMRHQADAELVA